MSAEIVQARKFFMTVETHRWCIHAKMGFGRKVNFYFFLSEWFLES